VVRFYYNGNASAGTRVGKAMQKLKVLARDIRAEVDKPEWIDPFSPKIFFSYHTVI